MEAGDVRPARVDDRRPAAVRLVGQDQELGAEVLGEVEDRGRRLVGQGQGAAAGPLGYQIGKSRDDRAAGSTG